MDLMGEEKREWLAEYPGGKKEEKGLERLHSEKAGTMEALNQGFPSSSVVKNPPSNTGIVNSIPELGRSPGEGNGNSLQYSCLGNPIDRGAWRATVHGVMKSWMQLSNWTTIGRDSHMSENHSFHYNLHFSQRKSFFCSSKPCLSLPMTNTCPQKMLFPFEREKQN